MCITFEDTPQRNTYVYGVKGLIFDTDGDVDLLSSRTALFDQNIP